MERFTNPLCELAFLPGAVICCAKGDQYVVGPKPSNCVGESAQRRLVAHEPADTGSRDHRVDLSQHGLQTLVGFVPYPIGIRGQPLKPTRQHGRDHEDLRRGFDQSPDEQWQLIRSFGSGPGHNQQPRFFLRRHDSALRREKDDRLHITILRPHPLQCPSATKYSVKAAATISATSLCWRRAQGSQGERRVKADPPRLLIAPPAPQAVERPLGLIARAARVPSTRDRGESCAKRVLPTVLDTARAVRGTVLSRCKWSTTATLYGLHAH